MNIYKDKSRLIQPNQQMLSNINKTAIYLYLILASIYQISYCGAILNQTMITFEMMGATTFTPDAGGQTLNGYKLRLGFSKYNWLGVRFVMNNNKDDFLVMQIDEFYSESDNPLRIGHQVTAGDYYISSDLVDPDRNKENDISAFQYVQTKDYYIDLIRYSGSNDGEDWNGAAYKYSLLEVCFYTSDEIFDIDRVFEGISACYSYEINNYFSTFKGQKLKTFYLNGYMTQVNGWIDGPYVTGNLYFYQPVMLYTYTEIPAFILEVGTTTNEAGQDFYVVSPISSESGDYYGKQPASMVKDTTKMGGYQNGIFQLEDWNMDPAKQISQFAGTAFGLTFSRNISTGDPYDKSLKSTMVFCLYLYSSGSITSELSDKGCEAVQISSHYPRAGLLIKPVVELESMLLSSIACLLLVLISLIL